jgi:hypothetical protein
LRRGNFSSVVVFSLAMEAQAHTGVALASGFVLAGVIIAHRLGYSGPWLNSAGAGAVLGFEIAMLLWLGSTGDNYGDLCMQPECVTGVSLR